MFKAEAIVSFSLLFLIFTIVTISMISSENCDILLKKEDILAESVQIMICGDVKKAKKYSFPAGITYGEVINRAKPRRTANLEEWDFEKKIFSSQSIRIKKLKSIQVQITGEVKNPGALEVDVDTKLCHLKKKIALLPSSDVSELKSRRYLRHSETIHIPKKCK